MLRWMPLLRLAPDLVTWNTLLKASPWRRALEIFREMKVKDISLNIYGL